MLREIDMKWQAIAYTTFDPYESLELLTEYREYKKILERTEILDNLNLKRIYGSDYYFSHFFADTIWFNGLNLKRQFNEMILTILNEDIDKVFVLDSFNILGMENLSLLSRVCRDKNVELLFPKELKDNVAYPELFDMYADWTEEVISNVQF